MKKYFGLKNDQTNITLFFDIGHGQLNFRMYNQELRVITTLYQVEQYLGKVCGKNCLDNSSLQGQNVG